MNIYNYLCLLHTWVFLYRNAVYGSITIKTNLNFDNIAYLFTHTVVHAVIRLSTFYCFLFNTTTQRQCPIERIYLHLQYSFYIVIFALIQSLIFLNTNEPYFIQVGSNKKAYTNSLLLTIRATIFWWTTIKNIWKPKILQQMFS